MTNPIPSWLDPATLRWVADALSEDATALSEVMSYIDRDRSLYKRLESRLEDTRGREAKLRKIADMLAIRRERAGIPLRGNSLRIQAGDISEDCWLCRLERDQ